MCTALHALRSLLLLVLNCKSSTASCWHTHRLGPPTQAVLSGYCCMCCPDCHALLLAEQDSRPGTLVSRQNCCTPHLALPAVDQALANVLHANALDEVTDLHSSTSNSPTQSAPTPCITTAAQTLHRLGQHAWQPLLGTSHWRRPRHHSILKQYTEPQRQNYPRLNTNPTQLGTLTHLVVVHACAQGTEEVDGLAGECVHQDLNITTADLRGTNSNSSTKGCSAPAPEATPIYQRFHAALNSSAGQHTGCMCRASCRADVQSKHIFQADSQTVIRILNQNLGHTWSSWKIPMQTPMRSSRVGFQ